MIVVSLRRETGQTKSYNRGDDRYYGSYTQGWSCATVFSIESSELERASNLKKKKKYGAGVETPL